MTVERAADYLEISPEKLRSYESGSKEIPLRYVYGLSNCLGVDPEVILKLIRNS